MLSTRRHFMLRSGAFAVGFAGLRNAFAREALTLGAPRAAGGAVGYGPLQSDPLRIFELPRGFGYQVISKAGDVMDDGLFVPGKHDGMAAFPDPAGPPTRCVIVRNHEVEYAHDTFGAFGPKHELLSKIDAAKVFDRGGGTLVSRGGTTTLTYDTGGGAGKGRLEGHWLSLAGTERNCAGGPTPRNTWISCEESVVKRGGVPKRKDTPAQGAYEQDHGWCFEVPALTTPGLVAPKPIKPMGRFYHEACATNPLSGVVYMSEDRDDGLMYRYVPVNKDKLLEGGRLQALAVVGKDSLVTRNWDEQTVSVGEKLACRWIDMEDIESPDDSLRKQGFEHGAAKLARVEGMWMGADSVYFAATSGGKNKNGQIWRCRPAPAPIEGTPRESDDPGTLELFIEANDRTVIKNPDNLTVAPWGDLIVCEDDCVDCDDAQRILGVTPRGEVYVIGRSVLNRSELAGCTFSPDGTTLFVNIQSGPGLTLAIWGPWKKG
jgi:secreted PhoX family phosphatase